MTPITKQEAIKIIDKNGFIEKGEFDVTWEDVQYVVKCDLLESGHDHEVAENFINNENKVLKYVKRNWSHVL